jgi:hypothetical protein
LPAMRRILAALPVLVLVAGCGGSEQNLAVVASAPGSIGTGVEQRMLVGLIDPATSESLASPDLPARLILTGPDEQSTEIEAAFIWVIEGVRGLYVGHHRFDQAGAWSVRVEPRGMGRTPATPFFVVDDVPLPEIGEVPPAVPTATVAGHRLEKITSDPHPLLDLYQHSLDEALGRGRPLVVIFATPAFCVSQTCGPLLDQVKALSPDHPGATFLHIEVYENLDAQSTSDLRPAAAVEAWGLPSEPWVYVIDRTGKVAARFEGAASDDEIVAALRSVGA